MGYTCATFQWLGPLAPQGCRVLDLGSQDIQINSAAELRQLNDFIGNGAHLSVASYPAMFKAGEVWTRTGRNYSCVDVDDRPGTIYVDLQACEFPAELKYAFDLVVNAGTTEHLANPAGGLAFAHFACRDGGVMAHDVPLFGFMNHALNCPTPKFWTILRWLNDYEILSANARKSEELPGAGDHYSEHVAYINGLAGARNISWLLSIAYRKRGDAGFVAPIDAVVAGSKGDTEAKLIASAMLPFIASGVWSESEADAGIRRATKAIKGRPFPLQLAAKLKATIVAKLKGQRRA
jgi:hypothetical protein